jgi:putative membrane protein
MPMRNTGEPAETFVIMERRLIKVIMNPAMMVSWAAGFGLPGAGLR